MNDIVFARSVTFNYIFIYHFNFETVYNVETELPTNKTIKVMCTKSRQRTNKNSLIRITQQIFHISFKEFN